MKRCTDKNLHQIFCYDSSSSSIQPPTWRWRWRSSRTKPSFKTIASFLFFFLFFLLGLFIRLDWIKAPIYWRVKGVENNRSISDGSTNATCPPHFRWIHEDLRPWRETGITREMVERARKMAHFRVVIVDGRVYVEKYKRSIQTRDLFTMWGLLQLVRWYPGRLPDLELMFDCDDRPVVRSNDFLDPKSGPPPLFRYCSDESSLDIVFPDWSFWGWGEINIKPWRMVLEDIKEGNKRTKWKDRVPFAYWKGNPYVDPSRKDLLKCNLTQQHNWDTLLYVQDWDKESKEGYKQSNLEDQCTHRYKIYIEGWAWSVSEKYIMTCDSMTLYMKPRFYDFFIRGMLPLQHFWPINDQSKCPSLKFGVQWGNNNTNQAQAIGEEGSKYLQENLKMELVYDYMFHLLNEYSKLLKFRPSVPSGAMELKPETMTGATVGLHKKFLEDSLEKSPSDTEPCDLPPHDPTVLNEFREKKLNALKQVEIWENEYWENQRKGN
ncbi:protein O-glucosyltransferase 1-like isoform X1 [Benincasa hispida]|uniref:protein O-glucosyltransferase 1-like isoform X1 n=1 Tax=Benincasa hispida TaxID=102211 RepID=UPI00190072E0|nr:protein O-glucosyltransferase 1-like isoform X1 [Benincasa hispida]